LPLVLGLSFAAPLGATQITVGFDSPIGDPIPLRLNQGRKGWSPMIADKLNSVSIRFRDLVLPPPGKPITVLGKKPPHQGTKKALVAKGLFEPTEP